MGMAEPMGDSNVMYLYIIKGHLMQKVDEGTPGAIKREYEGSDGSSGVKYELQYKNLEGYITGIDFRESDFGDQCTIKMSADGENAQLQIGLDSRYFATFAERFSNINLSLPVTLNAYDFEQDGKKRSGMSVVQDGKKVESYFWDKDNRKAINGVPLPENGGDGYDKDDWKYYFSKKKKFLKNHIENEFLNLVGHSAPPEKDPDKPANPLVEHSKNDPSPEGDDLPF